MTDSLRFNLLRRRQTDLGRSPRARRSFLCDCSGCSKSAYLVRSIGCTECTYCFGCVGLSKKDFHILNVKYKRDEYFKQLKALKRELGLS